MFLIANNITKSYPGIQGKTSRLVLDRLNLEVRQGEKIAIVGPSGSGKTTLLNIIGTLDKPDTGEVLFKDRPVLSLSSGELARVRNLEIGFVFQFHYLLPQLTLYENVLLPALPNKKNVRNARLRAEHLLHRTGIWEQRDQKPAELSGGECQRAAFVRSLINEPDLILADEPTGALDEKNSGILGKMLADMNTENLTTLLVVTHSMELAKKMDTVYRLTNGVLKKE